MTKAIIFDIDGTLTDNLSWLKMTELLGASAEEHSRIFDEFLHDKVSYIESKKLLMALWRATGNANKEFLTNIFRNWTFLKESGPLIGYCKDNGYEVALITGSVDLFAEETARYFGITYWYADAELIWDESGELIDFNYERDQASKKLEQFEAFIKLIGVRAEDCYVVGDGANDIKLFARTKKGIAVNTKDPDLKKVAWKGVDSLNQVKEFI